MTTLPAEAWADLRNRVRRFVGGRVSDTHAADDVTQDVLLKLQAHLGELPPEEKLPAWLFAVARNAVTDYYRARAVREHAEVPDAGKIAGAADVDAEQGDATGELASCLRRMVEHLPEPYREAMRLTDFEGLSQQGLAERTGVSLSGAKSRVQRARGQLREMILGCCRVERDARGNVADFETTERSARYCREIDGDAGCGR